MPETEDDAASRAADAVRRELEAGLHGFTFAVGRSRPARDAADLHRAGNEALLAANVAEASEEATVLAFDATGAYRLLLPAMSEDPVELQRFYAETVEPLVAYDEQYETDLVQTLESFLDADGNVAQTAQRLFTHRHTIRYRLERVRELSGLDVGSTDGREKLGLGLKAMRVLGIPAPHGRRTSAAPRPGASPRNTRIADRDQRTGNREQRTDWSVSSPDLAPTRCRGLSSASSARSRLGSASPRLRSAASPARTSSISPATASAMCGCRAR